MAEFILRYGSSIVRVQGLMFQVHRIPSFFASCVEWNYFFPTSRIHISLLTDGTNLSSAIIGDRYDDCWLEWKKYLSRNHQPFEWFIMKNEYSAMFLFYSSVPGGAGVSAVVKVKAYHSYHLGIISSMNIYPFRCDGLLGHEDVNAAHFLHHFSFILSKFYPLPFARLLSRLTNFYILCFVDFTYLSGRFDSKKQPQRHTYTRN